MNLKKGVLRFKSMASQKIPQCKGLIAFFSKKICQKNKKILNSNPFLYKICFKIG